MSRYAIQWVLFSVFCAAIAWWWIGYGNAPEPPAARHPRPAAAAPVAEVAMPATRPISKPARSDAAASTPPAPETGVKPSPADDTAARLRSLLNAGRYEAAVELYSTIYDRVSEADSAQYREMIFAKAKDLMAEQDQEAARRLMLAYVAVFYRDLGALRLLAQSQRALELYDGEIDTLLAALEIAYLAPDIASLRQRLEGAVADRAGVLSNDPAAVLQLYRDLASRKPSYEELQMGLARALLRVGHTDEAAQILQNLTASAKYGEQASELLESTRQKRLPDTVAVPMRRVAGGFVVDAVVNGRQTVSLMIDTGASLTVIRPGVLQLAGADLTAPVRVSGFKTANGAVRGPVVRVHSLAIGDRTVDNVEVGSLPLAGLDGIDGLLGMNVLKSFKFTLNQEQQVLLLNR